MKRMITSDELKCNFCGKMAKEVSTLIAGPGVFICDVCIELCNEIIYEKKEVMEDDLNEFKNKMRQNRYRHMWE